MPIYVKNTWTDRNVSTPINYTATKGGGGALNSGDTLSMTASPGVVTSAGTPITASYMNNIEVGLEDTNNGRWIEFDGDTTTVASASLNIPISETFDDYKLEINFTPSATSSGVKINFNSDTSAIYETFWDVAGGGSAPNNLTYAQIINSTGWYISTDNTTITFNFSNPKLSNGKTMYDFIVSGYRGDKQGHGNGFYGSANVISSIQLSLQSAFDYNIGTEWKLYGRNL